MSLIWGRCVSFICSFTQVGLVTCVSVFVLFLRGPQAAEVAGGGALTEKSTTLRPARATRSGAAPRASRTPAAAAAAAAAELTAGSAVRAGPQKRRARRLPKLP